MDIKFIFQDQEVTDTINKDSLVQIKLLKGPPGEKGEKGESADSIMEKVTNIEIDDLFK